MVSIIILYLGNSKVDPLNKQHTNTNSESVLYIFFACPLLIDSQCIEIFKQREKFLYHTLVISNSGHSIP